MSNQGVRGFYQLTETIKNQLLTDINVKTVTTGNFSDIDIQKQSIFPLSHIIIQSASQEDGVLRFSISVLSMDIVNRSKKATTDLFTGNNDEQDILNTQLSVVNKLIQVLRGGTLHQDGYQFDGNGALSPFYDRFDNELAGWEANFDVLIYNDIKIC
tara:strand:+ start:1757 stop:2227 length:471 start_codon:yes stop_codon:yes gene_type:complete